MNSALDANGRQTITARLNTDGLTITRVEINSLTNRLLVDATAGGTDQGGTFAATDDNDRPTSFAVSNADGITPVALYVNSSGRLLIKST